MMTKSVVTGLATIVLLWNGSLCKNRYSDAFLLFPHRSLHSASLLSASVSVQRGSTDYMMDYQIVNKRKVKEKEKDEDRDRDNDASSHNSLVVVVHGGPGLPSNYLMPLKDQIKSRPLLFYDQLGCGKSDEPQSLDEYSIQLAVNDLSLLIQEVVLNQQRQQKFHLFGHSYGGVVVYEYLKQQLQQQQQQQETRGNDDGTDIINRACLSAVLSNAPANIGESNAEWERLTAEISLTTPPVLTGQTFERQHICRTLFTPIPLLDAYQNAGKVWVGTDVIQDYTAEKLTRNQQDLPKPQVFPPTLLLRGQYDFVTLSNLERWKEILDETTLVELQDCSHHPLLEKPVVFCSKLEEFWKQHE